MIDICPEKGCILKTEKSSMYDGGGLRSVIFFKGCPMSCAWCSTPESQRFEPEIGIDPEKCAHCGTCATVCHSGAMRYTKRGALPDAMRSATRSTSRFEKVSFLNRELCDGCFLCADACHRGAIKKYGSFTGVQELADEVSRDDVFYFHSGGGVTLSGGEPCAQLPFTVSLLQQLKARGIHTAIETALYAPWKNIESLLPYLDSALVDLKHMDTTEHKHWTGVDNDLILDNIRQLSSSSFSFHLTLRIPLVPGINDSDGNLGDLAKFSRELSEMPQTKLRAIELLPYHRLGAAAYRLLDKPYLLESTTVQTKKDFDERASFFLSCNPGVQVFPDRYFG